MKWRRDDERRVKKKAARQRNNIFVEGCTTAYEKLPTTTTTLWGRQQHTAKWGGFMTGEMGATKHNRHLSRWDLSALHQTTYIKTHKLIRRNLCIDRIEALITMSCWSAMNSHRSVNKNFTHFFLMICSFILIISCASRSQLRSSHILIDSLVDRSFPMFVCAFLPPGQNEFGSRNNATLSNYDCHEMSIRSEVERQRRQQQRAEEKKVGSKSRECTCNWKWNDR